MNTSSHYKLKYFIPWTRRNIYKILAINLTVIILYEFVGWKWIAIPWVPIALIGTAAAFITGFKNTQTYQRMWEARIIWGGIVNSSRTWGMMVKDFIKNSEDQQIQKELMYRHIAWMTALRFQLREVKSWENVKTKSYNREFMKFYSVPEWNSKLEDELSSYISDAEKQYILSKKNRATHLISLQSNRLKELNEQGKLEPLLWVEMENVLKEFYDLQGKSERIKNFPYPRQFASINYYFINLFVFILPLGLVSEFAKLGEWGVLIMLPFSGLVSWIFTSLEQVGESTENPFEGNANDIPITSMSRTIEIDLREMLDEKEIPPAIPPENSILM